MKVQALVLVVVASLCLAEPPVPSQQYLPSQQYGPPAASYGAPAQTAAIFRPSGAGAGRPSAQYGPPSTQYGAPGGHGGAGGYDEGPYAPANYQFEYHVQDAQSGNDFGHQEQRQGDVATGKYFVLLPDGRRQIVEYVADGEGYKPKITYEGSVGGGLGGAGGLGGGYPSAHGGGYPSGPSAAGGGYNY